MLSQNWPDSWLSACTVYCCPSGPTALATPYKMSSDVAWGFRPWNPPCFCTATWGLPLHLCLWSDEINQKDRQLFAWLHLSLNSPSHLVIGTALITDHQKLKPLGYLVAATPLRSLCSFAHLWVSKGPSANSLSSPISSNLSYLLHPGQLFSVSLNLSSPCPGILLLSLEIVS